MPTGCAQPEGVFFSNFCKDANYWVLVLNSSLLGVREDLVAERVGHRSLRKQGAKGPHHRLNGDMV